MKKCLLFIMCVVCVFGSKAQITFSPYVATATGSWAKTSQIADINNDGVPEAIIGSGFDFDPINDYTIKIGVAPTGGFIPIQMLSYPNVYPGISGMAIGNVGGNSLKDIIIGYGDSIGIFYQTTPNAFTFVSYCSGTDVDAIAVGDLNNDGKDDIAVSHWTSAFIRVFLQDTAGFSQTTYPSIPAGYDDITIADVTGDGLQDVIFMRGQLLGPFIYVYPQTISGTLGLGIAVQDPIGVIGAPHAIDAGDLNNDGLTDLVASWGGNSPYSKLVRILQSTQGTFYLNIDSTYDVPEDVKIKDLDCDGTNEIVVAHGGWYCVGIHKLDNSFVYTTETLFPLPYDSHYMPGSMDVGNINGNSSPDIVITGFNAGAVILKNMTPPIIINDAIVTGTSSHTDTVLLTQTSWINTWDIVVGDTLFSYTDSIVAAKHNIIGTTQTYITVNSLQITCNGGGGGTFYDTIVSSTLQIMKDTIHIIFVDTTLLTGIQTNEEHSVLVYPNPTTGVLHIDTEKEAMEHVQLLGPTGAILNIPVTQANSIDLSGLSPGVYILRIMVGAGATVTKILKQ